MIRWLNRYFNIKLSPTRGEVCSKEGKIRNKRKLIFTSILLVTGITLGVWLVVWIFRCPREIDIHIGEFKSKDAGMRFSIQKLSAEIRRCSEAKLYRIIWTGPGSEEYQGVDSHAILYDRDRKRLGYEHDVYSGIAGKVYIVDDSDIRAVAELGGTLEDFTGHGQSHKSGR